MAVPDHVYWLWQNEQQDNTGTRILILYFHEIHSFILWKYHEPYNCGNIMISNIIVEPNIFVIIS